jgi:hypothetical protein
MLKEKELVWIKISDGGPLHTHLSAADYVDTTKQNSKQVREDGYEETFELSGENI